MADVSNTGNPNPAETAAAAAEAEAGNLDVYSNKKFKWTQADSETIAKSGVPRVVLTEFENKTDVLIQNILLLSTNVANISKSTSTGATTFNDIYDGFYKAVPTGRTITLPYIGKHPFHLETTYKMIAPNNSEYSKTLGAQFETLTSSLENALDRGWRDMTASLAAATQNNTSLRRKTPAALGAENGYRTGTVTSKQAPKSYESSNFGQFSTTFNLINETPELAKNHYWFIRAMLDALVPSYIDPMRIQVPYIYGIQIKDLLSLPLGFIATFDAKPMGSAKQINSGVYTPEAWQISMSFNSLFPISYQLLQELNSQTDDLKTKLGDATGLAGDQFQEYRKTNAMNALNIPTTANYSAGED